MKAPNELLAAYAAGGLTDEETARVEAWLAGDGPDAAAARAELAALRALIDETRSARPEPGSEPAWDDMARAIRQAVDEQPTGWFERWWRPLAFAGAGAVAVTALAVAVWTSRSAAPPVADTAAPPVPATAPAAIDTVELPGLEEAWEADTIVYDLEPTEEFEGMFATAGNGGDGDVDPVLDFRLAPEPYELLETIDDEQLEAVEAHLEGTQPS